MDKYKVGKGKPPRKSRFKKGKSGNPNGRPKGSRNLATVINDELNSTVRVRENGVTRTISAKSALSKTLVDKALKGDLRAFQAISAHERQATGGPQPDMTITASDIALLRKYMPYLQDILKHNGGNNGTDDQ